MHRKPPILITSKEWLYISQLEKEAIIITKIPIDEFRRVLALERSIGKKQYVNPKIYMATVLRFAMCLFMAAKAI